MQITEIIAILNNRIATLQTQRMHAVNAGNLDTVVQIDADIAETQLTIAQLSAVN